MSPAGIYMLDTTNTKYVTITDSEMMYNYRITCWNLFCTHCLLQEELASYSMKSAAVSYRSQYRSVHV